MKKFTRLWQLVMVLLLTSSVVFAQSIKDHESQATKMLKQKQIEAGVDVNTQPAVIATEADPNPVANQAPVEYVQPATQTQADILMSPVKPLNHKYQGSNSDVIHWSQMTPSTQGQSVQNFETAYDIYDAFGVDDFTVAAGPWSVQRISWLGSYSATGPINSFNITFYQDDGAGMPGAVFGTPYLGIYATDVSGTFTAYLPSALSFPDGNYWISIQAEAEYAVYGQWYWTYHDPITTFGAEGLWQNPLDGFATGFTTWTGLNTVTPGFFDYTFELGDETPPACADPSGVIASAYTATSANIGWTENGTATAWNIEYGVSGFVPTGVGTTVTTNPYMLSGLTVGVLYDVYVQADCGGSTSTWVGPYTFGLPDVIGAITPTIVCQTEMGTITAGGKAWYAVTMDANYSYNFSTCDLDVTCAGSMPVADADFTFYDTDGSTVLWYIDGLSTCGYDASTWGSAYESYIPAVSGVYYLQVDDYYDASADSYELGYIAVQLASCPAPSNQTATNLTLTTADLGWTENAGATAWEIELGATGFTPTGVGTAVATNPYTWMGLTEGTTYDWYVRAICAPGDESLWTGPQTFTTGSPMADLLAQYLIDPIVGDNRNLGAQWFNGSLWITDANLTLGNTLYEVDPFSGTLLNTYPQGTTSTWGMRDMAVYNGLLYAGDDNGFYSITPGGVVTTVFTPTNMGTIRALAVDPSTGYFYTKSFGSDVYVFDIAGNIIAQHANTASTYGGAYDEVADCIWWHATGGATGMQMVQMLLDGTFTGLTVDVPLPPCGPSIPIVGGAFMSFDDMFPGKSVFGVMGQDDPDNVLIFEAYDTGYPGQTSMHAPVCGAIDVPVSGDLTWTFGANTDTYELLFGLEGAMATVVPAGTPVGTGSYTYTSIAEGVYEWQVIGSNATGATDGLVYNFMTVISCPLPTGLGVANATATGIDLVWTSTSGLSNVEWGIGGYPFGTGTPLTGVTSPQTIAIAAGDYDFYVQDDCGGGDLSLWVGPFSFYYEPPPANDNCADATAIGEVTDLAFNTTYATADTYGSCMTSPNIWYNYTATEAGTLVVSLCGSGFDTKIGLFDVFDCGTMVEIGCNDDFCSLQSEITFGTVAIGDMFKIEVGGYSTNVGTGILNVYVIPPMYDLGGTITYANGPMTVMDAVTVELTGYGTTSTGATGMYSLMGPDGDYTLMSTTTKAHDGLNGLDVILTKRYIGSLHTFTPIQSMAADVNQNGAPDGLDVIMMKRRIGSLTYPAWSAPDYIFYDENVTIAGAPLTHDYQSLCSGDVNGSGVPELQVPSNDDCATPIAIGGGGYPVTGIVGTTMFATESCPVYLPMASGEVWYAIDLPYATNDIVIDLCGDALMDNGWITGTTVQCSCDGADYSTASTFTFLAPCVTAMTWVGIAGPGTFYYPVATGSVQEGFTMDVDVTETPAATGCIMTALYPAGSITPDPAGAITSISTCNYAAEYSVITGIVDGGIYEFILSDLGTGAYVTVTDAAGTILTHGPSPWSWTAVGTGDLHVHWSLNGFCATDGSCHVTTVQLMNP